LRPSLQHFLLIGAGLFAQYLDSSRIPRKLAYRYVQASDLPDRGV
jgi:hypothetical protein